MANNINWEKIYCEMETNSAWEVEDRKKDKKVIYA